VLPNLVRQFDSREDDAGVHEGFESEHAGDSPFDRSMVLLRSIVEVLAGTEVSQGEMGGLVPVEGDLLRPMMASRGKGFSEK
jgi:hypothetical protein